MAEKNTDLMQKIESLCKRRGFIFQGSELYGGLAGTWDYGPLGVALKKNLERFWWQKFVESREDDDAGSRIKLDKQKYLGFVNTLRAEAGLKPLKYSEGLEKSAGFRGKNILKSNDFSFEATRSGYTIENAFTDAGYWNPIRGESLIQGYYSSDELIEGLTEFKKSSGVLTDKEIEEIGISEVQGDVNGCPTQVIVQHFAGYIPPNYPKDQVDSFNNGLASLKKITPGWKDLRDGAGMASFYQKNKQDIDRIIQIIEIRIDRLEPIVKKVAANQWLSSAENGYLKEDESLAREQNELAQKINSAIKSGE
jgi:uncharacterized protein YkwD